MMKDPKFVADMKKYTEDPNFKASVGKISDQIEVCESSLVVAACSNAPF